MFVHVSLRCFPAAPVGTAASHPTAPDDTVDEERDMRTLAHGLLPILLFAGIGCGGGGKTPTNTTGLYVPLKMGNKWTYTVTEVDGTVSAKIQGVTAETVVGGMSPESATMAFKLVTGEKFDDKNGDVSYQNWADSRLLRYREISVGASSGNTKKEEYYSTPFKLRVWDDAEHLAVGKSWPEQYTTFTVDTPKATGDAGADVDGGAAPVDAGLVTTMETSLDVWTVIALDEAVTVPAGTFKALVLEKVVPASGSDKKYWFVRGIGKVKETGVADQTEELSAYTVN
jgi:hypothetical protein